MHLKKPRESILLSFGYMFISVVLSLFSLSALSLAGDDKVKHETPENRSASTFLPKDIIKGPHYEVQDKVVTYGYMDNFTVDSDYGVFTVTGDGALLKLIVEIGAITELENIKDTDVYLDALKEAGKSPLIFGKNLITDPVDTVTGVPKGVGRLFSNIKTGITKKGDPSEDDTTKQLLKVSGCKRQYAAKLNVDVYSSNPELQKALNSVGWACAAGGLTLSVLTFPISNPAVKATMQMGTAQNLSNVIADTPPSRLRILASEKLKEMGISEELADQFLDHPSYTPRHDTIIVGSLFKLGDVTGRDKFIEFALSSEDEVESNFFMDMAQILRGYNEKVSPIKNIIVTEPFVLAEAENGTVLIPFPMDYGVWTELADSATHDLNKSYKADGGKGKMYLWLTGSLSPMAKKQLTARGIQPIEKVGEKIDIIH